MFVPFNQLAYLSYYKALFFILRFFLTGFDMWTMISLLSFTMTNGFICHRFYVMGQSIFDAEGKFINSGVDLDSKGVVEYVFFLRSDLNTTFSKLIPKIYVGCFIFDLDCYDIKHFLFISLFNLSSCMSLLG